MYVHYIPVDLQHIYCNLTLTQHCATASHKNNPKKVFKKRQIQARQLKSATRNCAQTRAREVLLRKDIGHFSSRFLFMVFKEKNVKFCALLKCVLFFKN